jgi:hypothetical protein
MKLWYNVVYYVSNNEYLQWIYREDIQGMRHYYICEKICNINFITMIDIMSKLRGIFLLWYKIN